MNARRILILSFIIATSSSLFLSCSTFVKGEGFNLTKIGQYEGCYFAFDVVVKDDIAFVADAGDGLWVLDVSNSSNPTVLSHKLPGGVDHSVFVRENTVFVADFFNGLYIYNAANPSNLQQIGHYSNGNEISFVVCKDDLACIGDPYLSILNISDLATPTEIIRDGDFTVLDVIFRDNLLFCLDLFTGLTILNISDPLVPVQVNQWLTSEIIYWDIEIYNDVIFLASDSGLKALDISVLTDIQDLGVESSGETVRSLVIANDLLYISEADTDLVIYDVIDTDNINEIGHHTESGIVINSIYVENNLIYATAESDGLIIFNSELNTSSNEVSFASFIFGLIGLISICFGYLRNKKRRC